MNIFPMNTKYVKLIGAPGKGHMYELTCFTVDGDAIGSTSIGLAELDKLTGSKSKMRVNGAVWGIVTSKSVLPTGLPKFLRGE